jgi:hypothetical protein
LTSRRPPYQRQRFARTQTVQMHSTRVAFAPDPSLTGRKERKKGK